MLTVEDIRVRLGLEPFETYRTEGVAPPRATGRTTHMLITAVWESQINPVKLKGWSRSYTKDIVYQARTMADKLGLDPKRIYPYWDKSVQCPIYSDHYKGNV